jgi:hypothetical protein
MVTVLSPYPKPAHYRNRIRPEICSEDSLPFGESCARYSNRTGRWKADRLLLPANSPDLNPIEQVFGWLKGRIRKFGPQPAEALQASITRSLDRVGVRKCVIWVRRCWRACYSIV